MSFLIVAALTQAIIALFLFSQVKASHKAATYLQVLVTFYSLHLGAKLFLLEVLENKFLFDNLITCFAIGYGTLFYFYIQTVRKGHPLSITAHLVHFTPLALFTIGYFIIVAIVIYTYNLVLLEWYRQFALFSVLLFNLCYLSYALYLLYFRPVQKQQLQWIKLPLWFSALPILIAPVVIAYDFDLSIVRVLGYSGMLFFIFAMVLEQIRSRNLNESMGIRETITTSMLVDTPAEPAVVKYAKSSLTTKQAKHYVETLQHLMEQEKLYLESDLSLQDLANKTNISKHHLTEALNSNLGKNFYIFINEYRIEEAKQQMIAGKKDTLLQLAYASGFNSKSTFIKYFKQLEGVTPSQFRSSLKVSKVNLKQA